MFSFEGNIFSKDFIRSSEWRTGTVVRMPRFNVFSRNVNNINSKIFKKPVYFFIVFLLIKRILKPLFSFTLWLLNFSDLLSYGSDSKKRYTLRLLSMCLGRSSPCIRGKVPPFKEGGKFFQGVAIFAQKKTKIWNIQWQKSFQIKIFFSVITVNSNWEILTKNLVTFKK